MTDALDFAPTPPAESHMLKCTHTDHRLPCILLHLPLSHLPWLSFLSSCYQSLKCSQILWLTSSLSIHFGAHVLWSFSLDFSHLGLPSFLLGPSHHWRSCPWLFILHICFMTWCLGALAETGTRAGVLGILHP